MDPFIRSPRGRPDETRRRIARPMFDEDDDRRAWLEGTLLRPGQVATLLQVSRRSVASWAREGRLPSMTTPGGHRRFRADDVRALVERLTVATSAAAAASERPDEPEPR